MRIFPVCFLTALRAVIKKDSYEVPAIFRLAARKREILMSR